MAKSAFKIATYNVWHGLGGQGFLRFNELEPPGRKEKRIELQIGELSKLACDLVFLQEVNPIVSGSRYYASCLGFEEVHQLDQAGIEVFGWGAPVNLKTGLCTMALPNSSLTKIKGLKLSGSRLGWVSDSLSFQLKEFRYALFARLTLGDTRVLAVNLHLHHGPRLTEKAEERLDTLVEEGIVPKKYADLTRESMTRAVLRRQNEIRKVLAEIHRLRRSEEEVVLAGDFNSWGEDIEIFEQDGFFNVTAPRVQNPSWDGPANIENHRLSRFLVSPFPHFGNPTLLEYIRQTIDEPRMLDHILMSENLAKRVVAAERILDQPKEGLLGSDHFGLLATIVN
jgi:endonuclease/exonuclease/phosphatase family metal-dependent hydrolase